MKQRTKIKNASEIYYATVMGMTGPVAGVTAEDAHGMHEVLAGSFEAGAQWALAESLKIYEKAFENGVVQDTIDSIKALGDE